MKEPRGNDASAGLNAIIQKDGLKLCLVNTMFQANIDVVLAAVGQEMAFTAGC